MSLTKKQKRARSRNRIAKKSRAALYKKGLFGKKT
jgi:hypothetical protein